MNEKVENLVLEHLRAIRGGMARLNDRMDTFTFHAEMIATRQMLRSFGTLQDHDHADIASNAASISSSDWPHPPGN